MTILLTRDSWFSGYDVVDNLGCSLLYERIELTLTPVTCNIYACVCWCTLQTPVVMKIAVLSYQNKTMSEYNPIVINWAGRAKRAGLSFLIVKLGVPWTLPLNSPVLLWSCPKRVWFFLFRRELPHIPPNQQMFVNIHFPLLTKCLCMPDEMASRAGFGPSAIVWRPLI